MMKTVMMTIKRFSYRYFLGGLLVICIRALTKMLWIGIQDGLTFWASDSVRISFLGG